MNSSEKLQVGLSVILAALTVPIMFLNILGGIVAGIWLIILGKWLLALGALLLVYIATQILSLMLAPTLLLGMPITKALESNKYFKVYLLGALASLWTYIVVTFWCVGSFIYIVNIQTTNSIWPYLLLGYCVATGPWVYMASKEHSTEVDGTSVVSFFVCLGALAMMLITAISSEPTSVILTLTFAGMMIISWILQTILFVSKVRVNKIG